MNLARTAAEDSQHERHKVGAVIHGLDEGGAAYTIARANRWPKTLEDAMGRQTKLGNASTTIHAEVAAILDSPTTEGASIYITDLPCPNCAKILSEARFQNVYIDAQTHNTPLGQKLKPFFDAASLVIFKAAHVNVYEVNMDEREVTALLSHDTHKLMNIEHPIHISPTKGDHISMEHFKQAISQHKTDMPFAACFVRSRLGQHHLMIANSQRSVGLTAEQSDDIRNAQHKYKPGLQPINRLLLNCARYGFKIESGYLYSSQTPTSREFVNLIGAGYHDLMIGDARSCRDVFGIKALGQLLDHKIMNIKTG